MAVTASPAFAQDAAATATPAPQNAPASAMDQGEIIVTALKSGAQRLDKVPVAIQAFSQETLNQRRVRDGADLIQLIPGASEAQEIGAGYRIFSFRGSGAGGPVGDGMVGYYLDDTPFGIPNNQSAPPVQYFDIDRVEVLRGPQGTLYGQGSMGGTIIYHTKNPSLDHFTYDADSELSNTRESGKLNWRVAGAVSAPLVTDHLGIRLSGGYDYRAGYNDIYAGAPTGTPTKKDANTVRAKDFQAIILWKPDDKLTIKAKAWLFSTDQNYLNVMNSLDPPYAAYQGDVVGYDRRRARYFSNTITYEFGGLTLTNATAYQRVLPGGFQVGLNLGAPLGIGTLNNGGDARGFVNEFRLATSGSGPFHWVGGIFYQNAKGLYTFDINFPTLAITGSTLTKTKNASAFSEVSYDLFGGKLVPLLGIRYYKDRRTSDSVSNGTLVSSRATPDAVTWRANLAYYPTESWTVFFNASTGFRSGILQSQAQADAVIADGVPSSVSLSPDKLRNLEFGVKGSLFDRKVRVAASVYDIKYRNFQSAFNTSIGLSAFANLGDAKTQGLDLEMSWDTPLRGLNLNLVSNINTSKFTNVIPAFAGANPRVADGERLLNTPPYNVRLDANYETAVGDSLRLFANVHGSAIGKARNADATVNIIRPYQLYGANVGLKFGRSEVRLFVDNLSDERGPTAANGPTLLAGPRPRTIGVGFRTHFD
ncbi:TonB-dependent receptor [Sphingomonas sp.]|uniref:TonB-dependent receptor n=1 Tax=Sphingomonas sp. TaxID=28214 RepID=UPI003B3B4E56